MYCLLIYNNYIVYINNICLLVHVNVYYKYHNNNNNNNIVMFIIS